MRNFLRSTCLAAHIRRARYCEHRARGEAPLEPGRERGACLSGLTTGGCRASPPHARCGLVAVSSAHTRREPTGTGQPISHDYHERAACRCQRGACAAARTGEDARGQTCAARPAGRCAGRGAPAVAGRAAGRRPALLQPLRPGAAEGPHVAEPDDSAAPAAPASGEGSAAVPQALNGAAAWAALRGLQTACADGQDNNPYSLLCSLVRPGRAAPRLGLHQGALSA